MEESLNPIRGIDPTTPNIGLKNESIDPVCPGQVSTCFYIEGGEITSCHANMVSNSWMPKTDFFEYGR